MVKQPIYTRNHRKPIFRTCLNVFPRVKRPATDSGISLPGHIIIKGTRGQTVSVASADGRIIRQSRGDATIPVAPDVYMVTVGRVTTKLLVP